LAACAPRADAINPYERYMALSERSGGSFVAVARGALADPDWRVAAGACRFATKRKMASVVPAVVSMLQKRAFEDARLEYCIQLVGRLGRDVHADAVTPYLTHARASVRYEALEAMSAKRLGGPGLEDQVGPLVRDVEARIRARALRILEGYGTTRAALFVAVARHRWERVIALGGEAILRKVLRSAPEKERPGILEGALGAGIDRTRSMLVRILDDPELTGLHMRAFTVLSASRAGGNSVTMTRMQQAVLQKWRFLVNDLAAACRSERWYESFTKLRALANRPKHAFLRPMLAKARDDCRRRAVDYLRAEQARCAAGGGCTTPSARAP